MSKKTKYVIVGATSAMAEACARRWVETSEVDMTLVGRDAGRTERVAQDLRVRSPKSDIKVATTDFLDPDAIRQTADAITETGAVDVVLIAHGALPDQAHCQSDLAAAHDALTVNGVSPVLFAEAFAGDMAARDHGTIAIIGSVAGDRGRKSNYVYGSAKGLVSRYVEGLQHRFGGSNIKIIDIKPGPTDTPMTAHLKAEGASLAPVDEVASIIVKAVETGKPVVYAPGKWRIIMTVIRHMPRFVFNKLNI